ncbi:MAG TPA: glycoside hydrolase family 5 protein [Bacillota bacterium]|nr:glycoside hydrolase family 5 protein [Bacillota bacterium]
MIFKKLAKISLIALCSLLLFFTALSLAAYFSESGKILLPVKRKESFSHEGMEEFPPLLLVENNKIVDPSGRAVVLKGLMPPDPAVLHSRNRFHRRLLQEIKDTGANVVRIPVHPENYFHDRDYLWRYLDPLVSWAGELGMYVIIDWHYIGSIETGRGDEMPDLDIAPKDFSLQFWKQTAAYFRDTPHVIFEIFNEPAFITAATWARNAEELVKVIRGQNANQVIIVGGIEYARNLSWVKERPVDDANIVYAAHIYPAHDQKLWGEYFGAISEEYPVLITEWGFLDENEAVEPSYLVGDEESYGKPFLDYLEERNIGWVACWYDDVWTPPMLKDKGKSYTKYGRFVLSNLGVLDQKEGNSTSM